MKNYTTKTMPCASCGANSFRLALILRDGKSNLLRAYCNKCQTARDTAVGTNDSVYKVARAGRNTKKEERL